ncbi:MAG: D-alanine--D-alanine ligase [bacterium]|nr:D-alanine--D-alanine ligase [bacterium]
MERIKVAVLRGGPSSEYEVSLKTGSAVLRNLPEKYEAVDILIDKNGLWHLGGVGKEPHATFPHFNIAFNALHGQYGEDGTVQEILDAHGVLYTGSAKFASRLAMNKALAKSFLMKAGVKTPLYKVLRKGDLTVPDLVRLFRAFPSPAVVKPLSAGSSVGVHIVKNFSELEEAMVHAFAISPEVILEEYIGGREATCGIIDDFRGEKHYALPPAEIRPPADASFFDYEAKYGGRSQEICPGNFTAEEAGEIKELARVAHKNLGLRHYSRSDFIIHPKRGIYFLEANTLPGLTEESVLPKSVVAVGSSLGEFLEHVISLAVKNSH